MSSIAVLVIIGIVIMVWPDLMKYKIPIPDH